MSEMERLILGKMTEAKELTRVYELGVRPEVFEEPILRVVFEWMIQYWQDSNMSLAPTWVALEVKFPSVTIPHRVEESTEFLVKTLKDRWVTNQIQRLTYDAAETGFEDPQATLNRLWREAYDISEVVAPRYARVNMAETVEARKQRYIHRRDNISDGMTLGLPELDAHTRGILGGELCAVAAYTKTGKTFMLIKAAVEARRKGYSPLIMTLEQSIAEIEERADAMFSGVSYERLQASELLPDESTRLLSAREEMAELGPLYVETPARGERTVKNITSRARQLGADYLIVDQLSFLDGDRIYQGDKATTQKHGDIVYELKDSIAQASAGLLPCMLAVQLNRETMRGATKAQGGRGGLSNFAHSSMIEQTVDLALGLWRGDEARANNSMHIEIMGSRRCDLEAWTLAWHLSERTEISVRGVLRE